MHTKISHLGQKTYANNKNAGIFGLLKYYHTFAPAKKKQCLFSSVGQST
jgi:hypothetical protein